MRIQIFKNGKGLIHGSDPKRIGCDLAGTLCIGGVEIAVTPNEEAVVPPLFNGASGDAKAMFITSPLDHGYDLGKVHIKGGRLVPPPQIEVDMMELRCRVDALEEECSALKEENLRLANIFDTNSLNFLI
jgi:hypothetical protein